MSDGGGKEQRSEGALGDRRTDTNVTFAPVTARHEPDILLLRRLRPSPLSGSL